LATAAAEKVTVALGVASVLDGAAAVALAVDVDVVGTVKAVPVVDDDVETSGSAVVLDETNPIAIISFAPCCRQTHYRKSPKIPVVLVA
jgi:hypothetical protein